MGKVKMKFQYASFNLVKGIKELPFVINNAKEITHDSFKKKVSQEDYSKLQGALGYEKYQSKGIALDKSVKYYSSILRDETKVCYLEKDKIQYVFYKNREIE